MCCIPSNPHLVIRVKLNLGNTLAMTFSFTSIKRLLVWCKIYCRLASALISDTNLSRDIRTSLTEVNHGRMRTVVPNLTHYFLVCLFVCFFVGVNGRC